MGLKKTLILILFVTALLPLKGQDGVESIVTAYEKYQTERPAQKLHISFNQQKYFPGDTVFFKVYLLAADLGLWSGSQIVEINLFDSEGKVRQQAKIKTDNGVGANQLILPNDLEAGYYNFTAFTNWMRNFDVDVMFQQFLPVVSDKQIVRAESRLRFGIEGANLIDGILSNIIVKTPNAEETVFLKTHDGQLIDSVKTDAQGFGQLKLLSKASNGYVLNTGSLQQNLPEVKRNGYNLSVNVPQTPSEDVRILVSAKPLQSANSSLSFIITSKGKVVYSEAIPANQPRIGKSIGQDRLTPGLYEVSLLDENGSLLSFREFYLKGPEDEPVNLMLSTEAVEPRQSINLNLQLGNGSMGSEFSVSVNNADVLPVNTMSLEEKIMLQDRMHEALLVDYSFNKSSIIDNYLIIAPNPIDWSEMLNPALKEPIYGYSTLFQLIGIARDSSDKVLPANSTLMFHLQNDLMRYEVSVLAEGRFVLNLLDIYGQDEFFIMAEKPSGEEVLDVNIEWIKVPLPEFDKVPEAKVLNKEDAYAQFVSKRRKVDHSFEFFSSKASLDSLADLNRNQAPKVPILEADNSYNVEDFYLFPTFAEFINEVVRPLRVGQQRGKPLVRVRFLEPDVAKADPLYIIDGIATKNTAFFLSLDPKNLKTVSVIKYPRKLSRFGQMAKNGIVIVNTKLGNVREPLDESNLFNGLNNPLEFPTLDATWAQGLDNPEFRSTVYWNPSVQTNENGEATVQFYTSDDIAPLLIRVEGFAQGKPFTIIKRVETASVNNH